MKLNFSNDLGNGSLKGRFNGKLVKVPSIYSVETENDVKDPAVFDSKAQEADYIDHYLDHMDVSIQSSNLSQTGRFLVGRSAYESKEEPHTFDIDTMAGKAKSSLALIETLSTIAGTALKTYYHSNHKLPANELKVNVNMVTALPINEGNERSARIAYANRYTSCDHVVNIRNFKNPVSVKIHFSHIMVKLEGQVAVYDIHHAPKDLRDSIVRDFKNHYPKMSKGMQNVKELTNNPNICTIDVGEGTVDFAVFHNGQVNVEASRSMSSGYGNALEDAVDDLENNGYDVHTRAQLKAILEQPTTFANRSVQNTYKNCIKKHLSGLIYNIKRSFARTSEVARHQIQVIYVFGGGANPLEPYLREPLEKVTQDSLNGMNLPVVFINPTYAQYLNVDGLQLILNTLLNL